MAKALNEMSYKFLVECFDTQACFTREYYLSFHLGDASIDMWDIKNSRTFLKKSLYPSLVLEDLYIGALVNINGRQLKVVEFADEFTKSHLTASKSKLIALIKQPCDLAKIFDGLAYSNITVSALMSTKLSDKQLAQISPSGGAGFSGVPVVAIEILGETAEQAVTSVVPSPDSLLLLDSSARKLIFESLEVMPSGSALDANISNGNSTVCVIKPHCVLQGRTGAIIGCLKQAGLEVNAIQQFSLERQAATEWLDVYRDVYPEYNATIAHFCAGPSIVLKLSGDDAFSKLRALCGPIDPVIAAQVAPGSLRATFGVNKVQNGVHCTDLVEDVVLETQFFFKTINDSVVVKNQKW